MDHESEILKIAVTGSAGSGKSAVCNCLEAIGLAVLDCDVIAREVVEPGTEGFRKVVELFGRRVVDSSGSLDRKKLRKIIIRDQALRKNMESILHPLILKKMIKEMASDEYRDKKAVAVEVPLLFELGMEKYFDVTIIVIADDKDLVERICSRDCVEKKDALKMLALQMPQKEKEKKADYAVINKKSRSALFESVKTLYENIQTGIKREKNQEESDKKNS